jgi:2-isopropylmalate synthase
MKSEQKRSDRDVLIYDTTLRDGTQREGIALSCSDKLRIAKRLDAFGVAFIEGGWPGSNPKDAEFFERARDIDWQHSLIAAFGSTRRAKIAAEDDPSLQALLESEAPVCTIFGKTWTLHVTDVLRTSLDENLRMIEQSVAFLRSQQRRVIYDAEHFFDGYVADSEYAIETLRAAARGGAEVLALCDTNGGSLPWDVERIVKHVVSEFAPSDQHINTCSIGIHAHNDSGCAAANSLAAVRVGATHIQGTINGYGERCGNANLCTVMPDLELKLDKNCLPSGHLTQLCEVSRYVAEVANLAPNEHLPYVGRSAFAHKGGVHVSAMRRHSRSYHHVEPEVVGNDMRVVISELSGRSNILSKAEEYGLGLAGSAAVDVLEEIKAAESSGYSYEAAEASVTLLVRRRSSDYAAPFKVLDYKVLIGHLENLAAYSEATVKLAIGEREVHTVAEGIGPVEALDTALRKALVPSYPQLERIQLTDYKVRILEGGDGTASITRVLIDSADGQRQWSTVGASPNIIEASCRALVDSIEYGLADQAASDANEKDDVESVESVRAAL